MKLMRNRRLDSFLFVSAILILSIVSLPILGSFGLKGGDAWGESLPSHGQTFIPIKYQNIVYPAENIELQVCGKKLIIHKWDIQLMELDEINNLVSALTLLNTYSLKPDFQCEVYKKLLPKWLLEK